MPRKNDQEKAEARRKFAAGERLTALEASYLYGLSSTLTLKPDKLAVFKKLIAELAGRGSPERRGSNSESKIDVKSESATKVDPAPPPVPLTPLPDGGFDTCLTCGYADGFHLALSPGPDHRVILICPECGQRYDLGMSIGRSMSTDV